jgi:CBS domain-containing protein
MPVARRSCMSSTSVIGCVFSNHCVVLDVVAAGFWHERGLPIYWKGVYLSIMALKKVSVTTILKEKSSSVFSIAVDSTIAAAVAEMNTHRVGSIMVKDAERVVGIFTERDVLTRVVAAGRDPNSTSVRDVMTENFKFITPQTSVEDAMQEMTDKRVRHLPVMDGEELFGMLSIGDMTHWLLKVNEMEAENLRRYVFNDYPG